MSPGEIEGKFLDLLDGALSAEEASELRRAIAANPELAQAWQEYQEVVGLEGRLAREQVDVPENLTGLVTAHVREALRAVVREEEETVPGRKIALGEGFIGRLSMLFADGLRSRWFMTTVASTCVVLLGISLALREGAQLTIPEHAKLKVSAPQAPAVEHQVIEAKELGDQKLTDRNLREAPAREEKKTAEVIGKAVDQVVERSIEKSLEKRELVIQPPAATGSVHGPREAIEGGIGSGASRRDGVVASVKSPPPEPAAEERTARTAEIFGGLRDQVNQAEAPQSSRETKSSASARAATSEMRLDNLLGTGSADGQIVESEGGSMTAGARLQVGEDERGYNFDAPPSAPAARMQKVAPFPLDRGARVNDALPRGTTSEYGRQLQSSSGEKYNQFTENHWMTAKSDPVSTFSIDVDTGSYTNVRRFLQQGVTPPRDAVRIEEFLNYFDYNYPRQTAKPFAVFYEAAPSPLEPDRVLLKLGVKARDAQETERLWNIVFLIDVSGSMAGPHKLELVKRSLHLLADKMRDGDRVSIVTYANGSGIPLRPTGIEGRERIHSVIDSLRAAGGTNGGDGIRSAYDLAHSSFMRGAVNRVVLATDGDFNVGITDPSALISFVAERKREGIGLTTLGFGEGNINEGMMEQLANKGDGNYFYIDSYQEARKVFETDLRGTIETVAKDVKLQVEFNPQLVSSYRLVGYENRTLRNQDFHNDAVDAGEIGSGHTVTALYEVVLNNSPRGRGLEPARRYGEAPSVTDEAERDVRGGSHSDELAFLQVRYKEPASSSSQLLRFPIYRKDLQESASAASTDFRFAAAVSYFAHLLRGSEFRGNYTFGQIADLASGALGNDPHGYRREFVELVRSAASILREDSAASYRSEGRRYRQPEARRYEGPLRE